MRINSNAQPNQLRQQPASNISKPKTLSNPFMAKNYQDNFNFSPLAGRLRVGGENSAIWNQKVTQPGDDKTLQLMDNQISVIGNILEQQKNLAELAEDESLSDLDRIDLQIEMEELQKKLTAETKRMSMMMAGMSSSEIQNELIPYFEPSSTSGLLQRARERILNGEEWDVAETFEIATELNKVMANTDSGTVDIPVQNGEYALPGEIDAGKGVVAELHNWTGGEIVVTHDDSLPTVSQKIEMLNGLNLMSAESATTARESIDVQIANLMDMKQELVDFYQEYGGNPDSGKNFSVVSSANADMLQLDQDRKTVDTALGSMTFATKSDGTIDRSNPNLQSPTSPLGRLFSKMEKFFKNQIGEKLGYRNEFDGDLVNKLHAVGPAKV